MFERFTRDARAVVHAAVAEAQERDDRHVGTEHLLLALTARTQPDPAAQLLAALDVDAPALHAALERRLATAA